MCRLLPLIFLLAGVESALATNGWNITFRGSVSLDTLGVSVAELSGVTYLGPSALPDTHLFAAIQDSGGVIVTIEAEFEADANLVNAAAVDSLALVQQLDFEGIAFTGSAENTVYVSEENSPGVREYDFSTGSLLQALSIPNVFGNRRANRGFESLARSADGSKLWTANEEALTVDGGLATTSAGSTVRLLQFDASGETYIAGSQFAYVTEPIHGELFPNRSGLADLVVLPDQTVLALERSAAFASPLFLSSIFELDFAGATEVNGHRFDAGLLNDPNFETVEKQLLWSGAADGGAGQNLEGLALGPRLTNGNWVLFGVSDDSSSNSSTITSWELSAIPDADFDQDGAISGFDFLAWQAGFGVTLGAAFSNGDGDRDGDVDSSDLSLWENHYANVVAISLPEPTTAYLVLLQLPMIALARSRRGRGRRCRGPNAIQEPKKPANVEQIQLLNA